MSREEIQKLLGGYATGTLTPEEQTVLFEAALEDQKLFDALGREQPLRDLLRDPAARAHLLAALDEPRLTWTQRAGRWMFGHAVGLAAVGCFLAVGGYVAWQARYTQKPILVAQTNEPTRVDVVESAPAAPQSQAAAPAPRSFDAASLKPPPAPAPAVPPPPELPAGKAQPPSPLVVRMTQVQRQRPPAESITVIGAETPQMLQVTSQEMTALHAGTQSARAMFFAPGSGALARDAAAEESRRQDKAAAPAENRNEAAATRDAAPAALADGRVSEQMTVTAAPAASRAANLGVRYRVLRKLPNGEFEPVRVGGELTRGDTVKLSFEPNDAGSLTVIETGSNQALITAPVQRMTPFTTPEIAMSGPGSKELRVVFTRERLAVSGFMGVASSSAGAAARRPPAVRSETDERGAAYVVNPGGDSQSEVVFSVTLTWK